MWFDASAALAELGKGREIDAQPPATIATFATPAPIVASVASVATPPDQKHETDMTRHGVSIAGHPLTWTGRVVSLADWQSLTAWDKHGPDGRHWCGIARAWITQKGKHDGE